jgi:hypothetical protein
MENKLSNLMAGGDEGSVKERVDDFLYKIVGLHYVVATVVIIILLIVVIWLLWTAKESFMPSALMKYQQRDGTGEGLDVPPGTDANATIASDPSAAAGQPGSAAYAILNSSEYNCAGRVAATDNAWDWMTGVAKDNTIESMAARPKNDSQFSKILAGH